MAIDNDLLIEVAHLKRGRFPKRNQIGGLERDAALMRIHQAVERLPRHRGVAFPSDSCQVRRSHDIVEHFHRHRGPPSQIAAFPIGSIILKRASYIGYTPIEC